METGRRGALAFSKVDPADVAGLSDDAAYALMKQAYGEDEFRMLYDPYYVYLFSPWKAGALEPYQVAAQLDDGAADGFYEAIADKLGELGGKYDNSTVFLCHGDCIEDAKYVENILKTKYGVKEVLINYTGAVIGSHSGPGTMAVFFLGDHR